MSIPLEYAEKMAQTIVKLKKENEILRQAANYILDRWDWSMTADPKEIQEWCDKIRSMMRGD